MRNTRPVELRIELCLYFVFLGVFSSASFLLWFIRINKVYKPAKESNTQGSAQQAQCGPPSEGIE